MLIEVFVRGDAHTPERFWEYALSTRPKFLERYTNLGFKYSEKDTETFKNLNNEDRKKIKFKFINGFLQNTNS